MNPQSHTIRVCNSMLGKARFQGTYPSADAARESMQRQAPSCRSFVTFEIWTGTPTAPRKATGETMTGGAR